jgi:hypothetical protein
MKQYLKWCVSACKFSNALWPSFSSAYRWLATLQYRLVGQYFIIGIDSTEV